MSNYSYLFKFIIIGESSKHDYRRPSSGKLLWTVFLLQDAFRISFGETFLLIIRCRKVMLDAAVYG